MEGRGASFDDLYGRKSKDYDSRTIRVGEGGDYLWIKKFF